MKLVTKLMLAASALGFLLAVIVRLRGLDIFSVSAKGYSNACTNLALLAIAMALVSSADSKKA